MYMGTTRQLLTDSVRVDKGGSVRNQLQQK